jgi:hypothetical protein
VNETAGVLRHSLFLTMVGDMKVFDSEGWELTQDSLKDVLAYNPETGEFHWLVKPSARVALGQRVPRQHL